MINPNKLKAIFVYQMGGVGSTSFTREIRKQIGKRIPVHDTHMISVSMAEKLMKLYAAEGIQAGKVQGAEKYRSTISKLRGKPVLFITLVRDPIGMVVSSLFKNRPTIFPGGEVTPDTFWRAFSEAWARHSKNTDFSWTPDDDLAGHMVRWPMFFYDKEVPEATGFDVFASDFDFQLKHACQKKGYSYLVTFRSEDFDHIGPTVMQMLGFKSFQIPRLCVTTGELYRNIVSSANLSEEILDWYYSTPYAKHFYSDDEVQAFRNKWKN